MYNSMFIYWILKNYTKFIKICFQSKLCCWKVDVQVASYRINFELLFAKPIFEAAVRLLRKLGMSDSRIRRSRGSSKPGRTSFRSCLPYFAGFKKEFWYVAFVFRKLGRRKEYNLTLEGSFSAVSKSIFASKQSLVTRCCAKQDELELRCVSPCSVCI